MVCILVSKNESRYLDIIPFNIHKGNFKLYCPNDYPNSFGDAFDGIEFTLVISSHHFWNHPRAQEMVNYANLRVRNK